MTKSGDPELIDIGLLQETESDDWEEYVANHSQGTIYHTLAWKKVTEEGFGHRPYYLRARDLSGRIVGVLPMFFVGGLFGRRLVSMPMRDRGGVLAINFQVASALVLKAVEIGRELDCKYLELRSRDKVSVDLLGGERLQCNQDWITTRVDLTPGEENIWQSLDRNAVRWAVRKGYKKGVEVEIDNSQAAIDTFFEMFVKTRCGMGIPPFSKDLFDSIWENLLNQGKGNVLFAWIDSVPINAMINFYSGDTLIAAYAAPQNEWRKYYPTDIIFWETIRWGIQAGFQCLDFGADSAKQESLLWFKKKWGGVQSPIHYCYYLYSADSTPSFDSSSTTYELVRKVWAKLPHSISKPLGGWVTRQLS